MKNLPSFTLITLVGFLTMLSSCTSMTNQEPLAGSKWGEILNPSAERVISNTVEYWEPARGRDAAIHFYSQEAHHGTKSLMLQADEPKVGRWFVRVNVMPWSKYRFTGWIKTENLVAPDGDGAGFGINGLEYTYLGFKDSNDWTLVTYDFETGQNDCFVLDCTFNNGNGRATGRAWFDDMNLELLSSEDIKTAIKVDVASEREPMPEYIYGQFIEHLGRCIYGGIWAEMIEDRKFWFAPEHRESPWKIEGNRENLQMDKIQSFVGEQTPVITAAPDQTTTLAQSLIGLKTGMTYSGRIVLKSSGRVEKVMVRLGETGGKGDWEEVVEITGVTGNYQPFPLKFASGVSTTNAKISVTPVGSGKLWIGTLSLMPDDNIEGFRADVMALLKELNSPVYRWPGGNFVSGYDWKDGIGDVDKRPPRKNPAWTGVEHNDVGIHEFIRFCELLETEPYIAVNAGLGEVGQAREEVEYCNGSAETPMGKWRAANGQAEPWRVKWWSIGNEMYGGWQLGHMSTEAFVKKHNEFADAMWSVDPDIKLIAVGDPGPWDEMILANCADKMDYISEHFYVQDWHGGGLMTHIRQVPDRIRERAEIHRKYRREIPALEGKDIRICMDEWNYWYGPHIYGELGTRYFMRDALGIAAGINEFSKHSDIIFMANYAQTVNVIGAIKATTTDAVFDATGQALKMYRQYFGYIPVEITGETRPLDVAATLTHDRKTLTLSVVNMTWEKRDFSLEILNGKAGSEIEIITLTAPDDMSFNEPGQPEKVKIVGPEKQGYNGTLSVGAFEARIFRIKL